MKKLTDQELDSVFKNAAEGYQPSFDQAAWEAMNARMDEPKPSLWKSWMPFAFLGLMIFSAGVWVGTYLHEGTPMTQQKSEPNNQGLSNSEIVNTSGENATRHNNQQQSQLVESDKPDKLVQENSKRQEKESKPIALITQLNTDTNSDKSNVIVVTESSDPIVEKTSQEQKSLVVLENRVSDHKDDSLRNSVTEVHQDTAQAKTEEEEKKNEVAASRSLYMRLLASPDFSSIENASATSTGSNFGLLLEYQLTPRWSISSGGILSMKKYSSDEFTYGNYTADRMSGACHIVDIPLNINYRFLPLAKTSFYASAGLSSYIMLEEDYTYTFDSPSGSRDFYQVIEGENNEWFKMLNISLGVQHQIAPRIHLQVEPFLKAPLAGIGEWDVKLSSIGIFMGLKYKIK